MSDISSLRAELSRQQSINRELNQNLYELSSGVASAQNELANFRNHVDSTLQSSNQRVDRSHGTIVDAYEMMGEIDALYVRFKNMELANKKIRACNNKRYYDFANYTVVRKIVQGMMDNLNVNMVSDAVIYKSVEKQHLQTPDYWLTCVLISVMAWKNDDRELADRAMSKALELDKKSAAIFYMLFNLRVSRNEAALKWFRMYQSCELTGKDEKTFLMLFSLLCKTMKDNVDDKVKYEIIEFINKVIAVSAKRESFSEQELLDRVERYLANMRDRNDVEFHLLSRCCQDFDEMATTLMLAKNNLNILQFVMDVANVSEAERNAYLSQFIDEQIAAPNQEEEAVYEEIAYNEMVISCGGEVEEAKKRYQARTQHREKKLNLISEMMDWIYEGDHREEIDGQSRKNMFTLTATLQSKAYQQYVRHYRSRVRDEHPVVIGDYQTQVDFRNQAGEHSKIADYYTAQRDQQLSGLSSKLMIVGIVLAVMGIAGIFFLGTGTLVLTAVGAILAAFNVISNSRQRAQIEETCSLNISGKNKLMDDLFAEFSQWKAQLQEFDAYSERIQTEMETF